MIELKPIDKRKRQTVSRSQLNARRGVRANYVNNPPPTKLIDRLHEAERTGPGALPDYMCRAISRSFD